MKRSEMRQDLAERANSETVKKPRLARLFSFSFRSLLSTFLTFALLSAPFSQQSFAIDGKAATIAAQGLGAVISGIAAVNIGMSIGGCTSIASTAGTPAAPAAVAADAAKMPISGSCALAALNAAAMVAGIASMFMNKSPESALDSSGGGGISNPGNYDRNFDPNKPIASIINCPAGEAGCDCTGPSASNNPLCGPEGIKNAIAGVNLSKELLLNGSVPVPDGQTLDGLLAGIEKANNTLNDLASGKLPGGDLDSGNLGASVAGAKSGGSGKEVGSEVTGGGSFDHDPFGLNKGKAGPADRSGLGNISIANGLDVIDEETGKSLTLWKRLTRRMQGNQAGDRAFLLAKMEYIRKESAKPKPSLASATPSAAPLAKTSVPAKAPSAAAVVQHQNTRSPASIKPSVASQY